MAHDGATRCELPSNTASCVTTFSWSAGLQAANGRLPYVPPSYHASAGEAAPTGTASAYPTGGRPAVPPHQQQSHPKASSATHEATTVRNLVNLKKHTLKLTPRPNAPNVLDISFMLDAVSACRCVALLHSSCHWQCLPGLRCSASTTIIASNRTSKCEHQIDDMQTNQCIIQTVLQGQHLPHCQGGQLDRGGLCQEGGLFWRRMPCGGTLSTFQPLSILVMHIISRTRCTHIDFSTSCCSICLIADSQPCR